MSLFKIAILQKAVVLDRGHKILLKSMRVLPKAIMPACSRTFHQILPTSITQALLRLTRKALHEIPPTPTKDVVLHRNG